MFKKSNNMIETTPTETLSTKLIEGKLKIGDLDLEVEKSFEAAINALNSNNELAKELDPKKTQEKELILQWLICSNTVLSVKNKVIYLNEKKIFAEENHDNDIIKTYLDLIFSRSENVNGVKIFKSFKDELVLKLTFITQKGEEIVYRDKELDLPVSLLAELELFLKITDLYSFLKYLDVSLSQISVELLMAKVTPQLSTMLRSSVLDTIQKNDLCYYDLTKYYGEISNTLQEQLQKAFNKAGVEISGTYIKSTTIPDGADKIFEEQRILFMQQEKELDLQHKAELMSLENYEKKAEIHNRYPSYEIGLTEKEKDNAINRYLIKQSGHKEENYKVAKKVSLSKRNDDLGEITSFQKEKSFKDAPISYTPNAFKGEIWSIILAVIMLIIGFATLPAFIGFVFIGISIVVFGIAIASIVNKQSTLNSVQATSPSQTEEMENTDETPKEERPQ